MRPRTFLKQIGHIQTGNTVVYSARNKIRTLHYFTENGGSEL